MGDQPEQDQQDGHGQEDEFTPEDVQDGVDAAFAECGYMTKARTGREVRDWDAVVKVIYVPISQAIVTSKAERASKGVTRGDLMYAAFPDVPGPNDWSDEENPALAEAIYKYLADAIFKLARQDHSGPVQRKVGVNTPDMVMCVTKLAKPPSKDAAPLVYVTGDRACLVADFYGPRERKFLKMAESIGENLGMVMVRQPDHAAFFDNKFKSTVKTALDKGHNAFLPALEMAKNNGADADTDDE